MKIKNFYASKGTVREVKRQYTECEKQLQHVYMIVKCYLKTYTELLHSPSKKQWIFGMKKDLNRYLSKISKQLSNTYMKKKEIKSTVRDCL